MKTLTAMLAGMAGALVTIALVGAGGTTGKTIRAERFEVVDTVGKVRFDLVALVASDRAKVLDLEWRIDELERKAQLPKSNSEDSQVTFDVLRLKSRVSDLESDVSKLKMKTSTY
jgi:uncharacterized protein YlxW (UPF0749 family)